MWDIEMRQQALHFRCTDIEKIWTKVIDFFTILWQNNLSIQFILNVSRI